jgi:hypothetical protein
MKRLILLVLPWLLASCFDIREETTIAADGSGRIHLDYRVPAHVLQAIGGNEGLRERLDTTFADETRIRVESLGVRRQGDEAEISVRIVADSMLAFADFAQSEAFEKLRAEGPDVMGKFDIRREGLDIHYHRQLQLGQALGFAALGISSSERARRQLEYIVHLPAAATNHNADEVRDEGRTLIWKHSLGSALESSFSTDLVMPIPLPWWLVPSLFAALGLLLWLAFRAARKIGLRRQTNGSAH